MADEHASPKQKSEMKRHHQTLLDIIQGWLPVLTAVVGALWGLYIYINHENQKLTAERIQSDKEALTRRIEAQKPFLQQQLALYFDAAQVTGKLATSEPGNSDWTDNEKHFWLLYWSELSIVEAPNVELAMRWFCSDLIGYERDPHNAAAKVEIERGSVQPGSCDSG